MTRVDAVVIGAGVVGLACARRLALDGRSVAVLESHDRPGVETSSRNSEVVHAGIYYPKDSLKSRLCHAGRRWLYANAERLGVWTRKTGKLIVAVDDKEAAQLATIRDNALETGAEDITLISGAEAEKRAPGLRARAALWSPETGIVDSEDLMRALREEAEENGAVFLFSSPLSAVRRVGPEWEVCFGPAKEKARARWLINAAGLASDSVAAMAGIDIDKAGYRIHWCKGRYFRFKRPPSLNHLIYPAPGKHGLGVHLTLDRAGGVRLGPDAHFVASLDYSVEPSAAEAFAESVSRYWPGVRAEDLQPDTCGIRPKLSGPEGGFRDFIVAEESGRGLPGWLNLIGIESPGLTAAPAVADLAVGMLD